MEKARKALEASYKGICKIYTKPNIVDQESGLTTSSDEWVLLRDNIKCSLSYENNPNSQQNSYGVATMQITLFLSPEIEIPLNSKIEVTEYGATKTFKNSGESAIYDTHQEIILLREDIA